MTMFTWNDLTFDLEDGQRAEFSRVTATVTTSKIVGTDGAGLPYVELTFDDGSVMTVSPDGVEVTQPLRPRAPVQLDLEDAIAEAKRRPRVKSLEPARKMYEQGRTDFSERVLETKKGKFVVDHDTGLSISIDKEND